MSSYNRANATFGAYAAALGLLVVIMGAMVLVVNARKQENIPSVDYGPDAAAVRAAAPFPVPVPEGLPEGWTPTISEVGSGGEGAPVAWTLGFATPDDRHARLNVSGADPAEVLAEHIGAGEPEGAVRVRGEEWDRYSLGKGRYAMAHAGDEVTTVVSGSTDYAELGVLAKSLKPRN
ncbi:uncharacterized protein DUF4245 [Murinocardiopsis flavida]|uniref:Uncharacterized protein DUF4245 n=1 Tax=Murinocardiopsis flavida TaxID=645275 RepID=A0A2P8CR10_9ACTN|nr:DUF4245 domain-containing protein [Murinocardiopsis flavida]PSK87399.1 uncharacterized protein DUF4245 [Murinocardiopsis flavida]